MKNRRAPFLAALVFAFALLGPNLAEAQSVARQWNERNLAAIRRDFARPVVHARNLFHFSIAVYDGWAVYDPNVTNYLTPEKITAQDVASARDETISFAAYRVIRARYADSPGRVTTVAELDALMDDLGYDRTYTSVIGKTPAAVGNRIAANVLAGHFYDGSNEPGGYAIPAGFYTPVNPPLAVILPGNPDMVNPNRWQPLA